MNGGITAGQVLHFLAAHYVLGENGRAEMVLGAMLARQMRGEFQNGVRDVADGRRDRLDDLGRRAERIRGLSRRQLPLPPGRASPRAAVP